MAGKEVQLRPTGEGSVQVLVVPLHSGGLDGKAQTYTVRDETGRTIASFNAATRMVDASGANGVVLPTMTSEQRDAIVGPAYGTMIYNSDGRTIEYYRPSSGWSGLALA